MLILSRKINESIFIGDDIEIKIVDKKKKRVKIGINAKKEVVILRGELMEKIKKEMKKAIIEGGKNGGENRNNISEGLG